MRPGPVYNVVMTTAASDPVIASATIAAKRSLRETVVRNRDCISPTQRTIDSAGCVGRLLDLPAFANAKTVLSYMSFGSELDTHAILVESLARGKVVALPRMVNEPASESMATLALHQVFGESDLLAGQWGIREPQPSCANVPLDAVDLMLVPGVAFDRCGHRLGYGKGYYDRLLAKRRPDALLVALAFDCQLVDEVPVTHHDVAVDVLITPTHFLEFNI